MTGTLWGITTRRGGDTRRAWLRQLLSVAALGPMLRSESRPAAAIATAQGRRYRVHATIHLLGVTLFTKSNVGGACAVIEEAVAGTSRTTALQFFAGSWPERLRGFNRFGMTQETVREDRSSVVESAYLSFMTSSAEKNLEQAKRAFEDRSASLPISVAHGVATRSGCLSALDHLTAPSSCTWYDCPRILADLRGRVSPVSEPTPSPEQNSALPTFLHSVRRAMQASGDSWQGVFAHNARLYSLRTRRTLSRGLDVLTGRISEQGAGGESEFHVWFDPGDAARLPVRIEFRPKSFLSLVFEHDPAANGPAFPFLMPEERT